MTALDNSVAIHRTQQVDFHVEILLSTADLSGSGATACASMQRACMHKIRSTE
jgi:hypothetical protein